MKTIKNRIDIEIIEQIKRCLEEHSKLLNKIERENPEMIQVVNDLLYHDDKLIRLIHKKYLKELKQDESR